MSESSAGKGGRQRLGSLAAVIGWIGAGAVVLATVALVVQSVLGLGLSEQVTVGLGLALGGGLGGVSYLLVADSPAETTDETMTVSAETDQAPEPQPIDLFDGHPDPVLYFIDEGHGPVVRAANESFGTTFDVPSDRLDGTALSEALLVAGIDEVDAETVSAADLDVVALSTTHDEPRRFRVRTAGVPSTGYLLLTPLETAGD
ncbi:hypothetical protein NDI54_11785 [Haloarcula sp. S1AR25-5A]|uniref:Uncharacterized protein n=1 Tax=Haloarcula terrestris TaxID=2950533 RepID=A0AAE4F064_9EURY|nr:hypothetical protein [Haloarcula terrestris]MDS0222028.1 hypothetical protein [Haloarcula terrestris]